MLQSFTSARQDVHHAGRQVFRFGNHFADQGIHLRSLLWQDNDGGATSSQGWRERADSQRERRVPRRKDTRDTHWLADNDREAVRTHLGRATVFRQHEGGVEPEVEGNSGRFESRMWKN